MGYARRASALHRARALSAAAWGLSLGALALAFEHPLVLCLLLGVVVAGALLARVGPEVAGALRWALPLAAAITMVNALVSREGLSVVLRLGDWPWLGRLDVTAEALAYGAVLGLRATVVVAAFALYSACVDPDALLRGFRRLGTRSTLTATVASRMVGVLARDARRMAEARRSLVGAPPSRALIARSVAVNALDRASDMAATLEMRGYRLAGRGSAPSAPPWSRADLAFAASALAVLCLGAGAAIGGLAPFQAYPRFEVGASAVLAGWAAALAAAALAPFLLRRGIAR